MNISQAFKYIDNAIEFWVELSEDEDKKSDVKKTDKARNIIRKTIEKNIKTIQLLRQERKK